MKRKVTSTTTITEEEEEVTTAVAEEEKMGLGDAEKNESGRTVVVGVRVDAQSKELLTWALVKVAESGDQVVALHVLSKSNAFSDTVANFTSSMIALVKDLDSMLAVYEGFCNLKQINLKLKICRGSSIRKTLVREVNALAASKVILGVTKSSRVIGSFSTSIAKYCARKLPRECWVVAVNNGKIVFQREAVQDSGRSSRAKEPGSSRGKKSMFLNGNNDELHCLVPDIEDRSTGGTDKDSELPSNGNSPRESCSVCSTVSDPAQEGDKEDCAILVPVQNGESSPSSVLTLISEPPESRWPLIRRIIHPRRTASEKKRISAAQLATSLSTQHSASGGAHPYGKQAKQPFRSTTDATESKNIDIKTDDKKHILKLPKELESLLEKCASTCRLFTYEELVNATSNFSDANLVGKGGNSRVFKGQFPDDRELAVKILKQSEDMLKEFVLEIEIITSLHHMNIISLIGFCFENNMLLLVYDFLSRGSLEQNLHDAKGNKNDLGWVERYKIAVGVAEALAYLHSGSSGQPIIHRDVKSSNILLSDDFEPQLSDFGLASWASSSTTHTTCSDVAGTFGYMAPEYFVFGKVNEKIDVYAFGVVLLELLSGRKPIADNGQESLVMWAKPFLQDGNSKQLLDSSLGSDFDESLLERMILAASLCIRRSPKLRPKMAIILKLLKGEEETTKWARTQFNAVEDFEGLDEESISYPHISDIQSHLSLALLDVEDDMLSASSASHSVDYIIAHSSLEAYLQERWSHSSSFC